MTRRTDQDIIELDLDGIREAHVQIVSGSVAATASPGTGRISVRHGAGAPVRVRFDDGVLDVRRDPVGTNLLPCFRDDVVVELSAPADVPIRVGVVSASVVARGFQDLLDVQSVSGSVTLDALGGPVWVKTVSGDVEARAIGGELSVTTVSGELALVEATCPAVDVHTVSGDVVLDLSVDPAGRYQVTTLSGDVTTRVDSDEPPVRVSTMSGRVSTVRGASV